MAIAPNSSPKLRRIAASAGLICLAVLATACGPVRTAKAPSDAPPRHPAVIVETRLGETRSIHGLTRGHNRKVIRHAPTGRWYVFWVRRDGNTERFRDGEGIVYVTSPDGAAWSEPRVIVAVPEQGGTSWEVVADGGDLLLLGMHDSGCGIDGPTRLTAMMGTGVYRLDVDRATGELRVTDSSVFHSMEGLCENPDRLHYYGSLLKDSEGYLWAASRTGPRFAHVVRSALPDSIDSWGPDACSGPACGDPCVDPFAGRKLNEGTVAPRVFDLGPHGVALIAYNKFNTDRTDRARNALLVMSRNPTRDHHGWEAPGVVLTDRANQFRRGNELDPTRGDDRRFDAWVDPTTRDLHVAYVHADTRDERNARLMSFTLSPPDYRREGEDAVLVDAEVEGVQFSLGPALLGGAGLASGGGERNVEAYLFFLENHHPEHRLRMIRRIAGRWQDPVEALNVATGPGHRIYPQAPLRLTGDRAVVAWMLQTDGPKGVFASTIDLTRD